MRDPQFLEEHNARHFWHPMAHPAEMLNNPPIVIASAEGVEITDINGHTTLDAVGGLWNVNLGYSCQPIKDAITEQLATLPYYSSFRGTSNAAATDGTRARNAAPANSETIFLFKTKSQSICRRRGRVSAGTVVGVCLLTPGQLTRFNPRLGSPQARGPRGSAPEYCSLESSATRGRRPEPLLR